MDALLRQHLEQNGHVRDAYTEWNDAQLRQCLADLKATHWTQETEEMRKRKELTKEEFEELKKKTIIIK